MKICDLPNLINNWGFISGSDGNESACNEGDLDLIPGWEDPLEEGMETPVFLPRTEEPGELQSMGSQRVGQIHI